MIVGNPAGLAARLGTCKAIQPSEIVPEVLLKWKPNSEIIRSCVGRVTVLNSLAPEETRDLPSMRRLTQMSSAFFRAAMAMSAAIAFCQTRAPLEIVSYRTDPSTSQVHAKIFNSSQKTVIATTLAVSCSGSTGGPAFSMDDYANSPAEGIQPGSTADRQLPCQPSSEDAIRVVAVVYSDRTAEGDSSQIDNIFSHRKLFLDTVNAERSALASAPDFDTASANLRALKGLDRGLISVMISNLKQQRDQHGSYEDFKPGVMAELDEAIPAAKLNARRAQ